MWVARAVLALLLIAPYGLIAIVVPGLGQETYTARVTMSSPGPSMAQVFFDLGAGVREADSTRVAVDGPLRTYDFALSPGMLQGLRLDPGLVGGTYTIASVAILRPNRELLAALDLRTVFILNQLSIVKQTADALVLDSPAGSLDPHFYFPFAAPLELEQAVESQALIAARLAAVWLLALAGIVGFERVVGALRTGRLDTSPAWHRVLSARATTIVAGSALIATFVATYPLLLMDRSLLSPGNGGVAMLYDHPPFVPGADNYELEDTRGADIGAMMWAMAPYSTVQREAVRHGEWPLWIRQNGAGRPLWGQGQSFFMDPLHWLTLLVPDVALGWDLKFIAHRLVFALGIGVAALIATGAAVPSAVAAAVAPTAGLYTFRFNHPAAFSVSYAPWILVGFFLLARAQAWKARSNAALLLACATTLTLVASPPKEGVINIAGCYVAGALSILLASSSRADRTRNVVAAGGGAVLAALVSAPHWLIFLDTLSHARTLYDTPQVEFANRDSALGFVLGNLTPGSLQPGLGLIGAVLAVGCLMSPPNLRNRRSLAACAIAAIALTAVAFGIVSAGVLVKVPLIGNIGHFGDVTMTALIVPALVLSAGGVVVFLASSPRASSGYTLTLAVGAWMLLDQAGGRGAFAHVEQWLVAFALIAVLSLPHTLSSSRRYPRSVLPVGIAVLTLFGISELGGLHAPTNWPFLNHVLPQPGARADLAVNSPAIVQARSANESPIRVVGLDALLLQGTQSLFGVEGVGGPDALQLGRYEELLDAAGVARESQWRPLIRPGDVVRLQPLLDLLNVGLVVTPEGMQLPGLLNQREDADLWLDTSRRPTAWPRAFFADGVRSYTTVEDFVAMVGQVSRPVAAVQATDLQSRNLVARLPDRERVITAASDYRLTTNRTSFRIRASAPGVAVLGESHMAGDFLATLNGRTVPYLRINHAFKGVLIPAAGDWEVSFEYRPAHWTAAWMAAGVGVLLSLVVWKSGQRHLDIRDSSRLTEQTRAKP